MVGIGTVLADDPSLTARLDTREGIDPLRIILDPDLEIPTNARIINQKSTAKTLIITAQNDEPDILAKKERLLKLKQVDIISFAAENKYFDLREILKTLKKRKISSLLVEGGAKLSHTFLKENLVDKFYYFIAPKIYGGSDGIASFCGKGPKLMSDTVELKILEQKLLEDNILLIAERK
jgi:diaminohydroxyphosphoribosylaminopyrimidine deaminase/5-amino-6-(5-phosphoribosylamino)uracil reductase